MKKRLFAITLLISILLNPIMAKEKKSKEKQNESENTEQQQKIQNEEIELDERFFFPLPPFVIKFLTADFTFDEGVSYCQLTRIEVLDTKSNFVRENMMIGPYVQFQTVDFGFLDYFIQLSAYYPMYTSFNGMKQIPRNMFNYAINTYTGITLSDIQFSYIIFNFSAGFHYMFQVTDEWFMHYIGIGGSAGIALPISKSWTIIENNFFSYDNPNLGKNKSMQPFDSAYQYHIDLGVKYSKRVPNAVYYIKERTPKEDIDTRGL